MKSPGKSCFCAFLTISLPALAEYYDWVNRFGGDDSSGSAIGLDAAGNVYVAGTFKGSLSIGTNQFLSAGGSDVFVAKLTSKGEPVWAVAVGGPDNDAVNGMAVAGDGATFVCGNFAISSTRVGNPPPGGGAFVTAVAARIDDGTFSWFDLSTNSSGGGITIQQGSENVWMFGARGFERFIREFNFDGDVLTDIPVAETSMGTPNDIVVSSNGCIYVSGHKGIAALRPDGQLIWIWHPPGANTAKVAAITLASDDLLFSSVKWVERLGVARTLTHLWQVTRRVENFAG